MKVKDLIKYLADFNPNADVKINEGGDEYDIDGYGWRMNCGSDVVSFPRDISKEKETATNVSFVIVGRDNSEN